MPNSFAQCGRAPSGVSSCSIVAITGVTAAVSLIQVKCRATVSRWKLGLSHKSSGATVRISAICRTGASKLPRLARASNAPAATCRGTRYSDCSSSPLLGVNSARK